MRRVFGGSRYANVTATLALVIALGGTSYAATQLERDSVGAAEIKRNGVRASEIKRGAVRSSEVKDGSLQSQDFDETDLPQGPQGAPGVAGAAGAKGEKGDKGDPGSTRAFGEVRVNAGGDFELVPGTARGVVSLTQGGGGNPAACIKLDPSIDAATAVVVATSNNRTGDAQTWDSQVQVSRPLSFCNGQNVVEVVTTDVDSPGTNTKRAFFFSVM